MKKPFSQNSKRGARLMMKSACLMMTGVLAGINVSSAATLNVSERDFPVAYDVDVLVVGGTSGGVAAAVEASRNGSRVFLMAQGPYLGTDICGTYRMWEDGVETPLTGLAADVLRAPAVLDYNQNPFTYESDLSPASSRSANPLTDGKKNLENAVQYDGDVTFIATLPEVRQVDRVKLVAFQNPSKFCALYLDVFVSDDKQTWKRVAVEKDIEYVTRPMTFSIDVNREARYVKLQVKKAPQCAGMLLSEIEILSASVRPSSAGKEPPPTPLYIKRTLDTALLDAGVEFLYGCYPTDVLTDEAGAVRGVLMANRAGRQVVRAKTIIDATPTAMLARIADAPFRAGNDTHRFLHTIVASNSRDVRDVLVKPTSTPVYHKGEEYPAFEYAVDVKTGPLDMHSYAEAQQQVLDKVWTPEQLAASEHLFTVPNESIVSLQRYEGAYSTEGTIPVGAFQSARLPGVYMLNGHADVSRECAEKLIRPVNYMAFGEQMGRWAAEAAQQVADTGKLVPLARAPGTPALGELKETLAPVRPALGAKERIMIGAVSYPVLGEYDVVVVGGGTSGGPAVIGAARRGAKTLVIEYQHGFGGVGTVGLIGRYWKGYVEGFTREVDVGVRGLRPEGAPGINGWDIWNKMEWYRREMRAAGAEMWMRSMAWGAVVTDGDVQGVAVSTPFGTGVVLANVVIDSTGNGDIAIAAGAKYDYLGPSRVAIQGVGLPAYDLGEHYNNSDFSVSYESDVKDQWHLRVYGKSDYRTKGAYDVASLVDTRERRRVLGDFYMTVPDQLMERVYSDTIARAHSDYDCHGVNYNPYVFLQPNPQPTSTQIPYRCLLPKGLDGILVAGMGISVHSDALPLIRMQADLQNQGYAAGVAAAMAAEAGVEPRDIPVPSLQRHLVEIGNIPAEVLTEKDIYPCSEARIKEALQKAPAEYGERTGKECAIILAHKEISLPLLRAAYTAAKGDDKIFYAHALAVLDDPSGLDALMNHVDRRRWDKGNARTTARMSEMDRLIIALGMPKDRCVTPTIVKKMKLLRSGSEFTHFRAVAIAFDQLRDPAAAPELAALLQKAGVSGHAVHNIEQARAADEEALRRMGAQIKEAFSFEARTLAIREISLARALYHCGDHEGLGKKILETYLTDLRGVLAAHAVSVLAEGPSQ